MHFQPKIKEVEMKNMVKNLCAAMVISLCAAGHLFATEHNPNNENKYMEENLNLIQEWDKTFPQSDKVNHKKITFHNRYGITLAADLYVPKNVTGKLPAIAISGPFGAVKEQASGLYAQTLAELVEKALISEPGVLSARSDLTAAEARYDQRAGALWPQVEATLNTAYNRRRYTSQPQSR